MFYRSFYTAGKQINVKKVVKMQADIITLYFIMPLEHFLRVHESIGKNIKLKLNLLM